MLHVGQEPVGFRSGKPALILRAAACGYWGRRLDGPGRSQGRVINTASIMGPLARPTVSAYVAAKGGLAALTRALAVELGPKGITCNAIAPGFFATDMTEALVANSDFTAFVEARVPLGRWGEPGEIAGAAVFLASPAASYINGHVLFVDGGLMAAV